MIYFKDGTNCT